VSSTQKFPRRTLLLMVLGLVVFLRMWCATHQRTAPPASGPPAQGVTPVQVVPPSPAPDGGSGP
jgi:hypothetical protein